MWLPIALITQNEYFHQLYLDLNYILEFDSLSEARIENLSQIDIEFGW